MSGYVTEAHAVLLLLGWVCHTGSGAAEGEGGDAASTGEPEGGEAAGTGRWWWR